jgi:hypothetical protein
VRCGGTRDKRGDQLPVEPCQTNADQAAVVESSGRLAEEVRGVVVANVKAAFHANDRDAGIVADWYGVQQSDVQAAVSFEQSLVA